MNAETFWLLLGAAGLAYFVMRRNNNAAAPVPMGATAPRKRAHPNGAKVTARGFTGQSWDTWMETAPQAFECALHEGVTDPEQIVANAFRRMYPRHRWPPAPGDQRHATWQRIVHSVAMTLEQPHRPRIHVVQ